jgi:hypothetical protein
MASEDLQGLPMGSLKSEGTNSPDVDRPRSDETIGEITQEEDGFESRLVTLLA